jgi:hypothetical protein
MFRLLIVALLALLVLAAAAVEVPYYGNNCGPGYTKGNPIDAADAACELFWFGFGLVFRALRPHAHRSGPPDRGLTPARP